MLELWSQLQRGAHALKEQGGVLKKRVEYGFHLQQVSDVMNSQIATIGSVYRSPNPNAEDVITSMQAIQNTARQQLTLGEVLEFHITREAFQRLETSGEKPYLATTQYQDMEHDDHFVVPALTSGTPERLLINSGDRSLNPQSGAHFQILGSYFPGHSCSVLPNEVVLITLK